jgi:hypothetical protein
MNQAIHVFAALRNVAPDADKPVLCAVEAGVNGGAARLRYVPGRERSHLH